MKHLASSQQTYPIYIQPECKWLLFPNVDTAREYDLVTWCYLQFTFHLLFQYTRVMYDLIAFSTLALINEKSHARL